MRGGGTGFGGAESAEYAGALCAPTSAHLAGQHCKPARGGLDRLRVSAGFVIVGASDGHAVDNIYFSLEVPGGPWRSLEVPGDPWISILNWSFWNKCSLAPKSAMKRGLTPQLLMRGGQD